MTTKLTPSQLAELSQWPNRRTPPPDQATRDRMRAGLDARIAESKAEGHTVGRFRDLEIKSRATGDKVVISSPWYSRFFRVGR